MHPHKPNYDRHAGTAQNKQFLHKISREPHRPGGGGQRRVGGRPHRFRRFSPTTAGGCAKAVSCLCGRCWRTTAPLAQARCPGALTPAGLGMSCLVPLVEAGFIDWIVSTGANIYHDTHYALGMDLFQAGPNLPDMELRDNQVIRIYDIVFDYENLLGTDKFFRTLCRGEAFQQTMGTAEFHNLVGKYLAEREQQTGLGGKEPAGGVLPLRRAGIHEFARRQQYRYEPCRVDAGRRQVAD